MLRIGSLESSSRQPASGMTGKPGRRACKQACRHVGQMMAKQACMLAVIRKGELTCKQHSRRNASITSCKPDGIPS